MLMLRTNVFAAIVAASIVAITPAHAGLIHRTVYTEPSSATINVAGLSLRTQTVNGLAPTCFTNPADTVAANTYFTPLSVQYLTAPASQDYIINGVAGCYWRDVEVTTWTRVGYVYLRLDGSGNAIYFYHSGATTNGTLEIGIVTGLDQSAYPGGTYYPLYSNANLVNTVSGYNRTDTTGATFTFGVSGFNIYAKFNGTQFVSFQDYRQMSYGGVALKSDNNNGHGFRSITFTPLTTQFLYSNYVQEQLDLRDFGLRSIQTTGSITAASNCLTVASVAGFLVNDLVTVEIGHESGAGALGTVGVGGNWPSLAPYATLAAMNADTSQPQYTFGWVTADGLVREWNGSAWSTTFSCVGCSLNNYYTQSAIPMSLEGRVSAIGSCNGVNSLTLVNPLDDALYPATPAAINASATATNANVYLDNQLIVSNLTQPPRLTHNPNFALITPTNLALILPAGTYDFAGYIYSSSHPGSWIIEGQGAASTTLYSPKGTIGAGIRDTGSTGITVQNLTLTGNAGTSEFGLNWTNAVLVPVPASFQTTEYDALGKILIGTTGGSVTQLTISNNWFQTSGIYLESASNQVAQNLTINGVFTNAIECQASTNCWAYNITDNVTDVRQAYTQWQLEWANDTNGGCQNCTITSTNLAQGFESFASTGTQFISPTSTNAAFSLNNAGGWTISNATLTVNNGGTLSPVWTPGAGMFQIDTNDGSGYVGAGGTITNATQTETGYIDSSNNVEAGMDISSSIPNLTINGFTYTTPNWATGSTLYGPQAIGMQGTNSTFNNVASCATVKSGPVTFTESSIGMGGSGNSLTNSKANTIYQGAGNTFSGNTTPCP